MLRWAGIAVVTVVAGIVLVAAVPGQPADTAHAAGTPAAGGSSAAAVKGDSGDAGAPNTTAAPAESEASKGDAGAAPSKTATPVHGPALLRRPKQAVVAPSPAARPGEGPPPPSPLTMEGLKQDLRRGKEFGGINPDAPAHSKLEQVLAELVKTRAALQDDTTRLENLTAEGPAGGASNGPPEGVPGQPPPKNPLDVLAKALRGIKPELAAPIVARIDKGLAATVLLKMPPVDAGKIMGALKPEVAAELATQIALRARPMALGPNAGGRR
jgi:hypothetical protein